MTDLATPRRSLRPSVELPLTGAAGAVAIGGLVALLVLFVLTATNAVGQDVLWLNAHWTVSTVAASALAYLGYRRAFVEERSTRRGIALGFGLYLLGQVAWVMQVIFDILTVPAISDMFFLSSTVPIGWGIVQAMRLKMSPAERTAFTIDAATLVVMLGMVVAVAFGSQALITADPLAGAILLLYPIAFLGVAGIVALGGLTLRVAPAWLGISALLGGLALNGLAWVFWVQEALTEFPVPGSPENYAFSLAIFTAGVGAYRLRLQKTGGPQFNGFAAAAVFYFPLVAALVALLAIIAVHRLEPHGAEDLVEAAAVIIVVLALARQSLLLAERRRVAEREAALRISEQGARLAAEASLVAQQASESRYRQVVEVFGHLAEQLSFAAEEEVLVRSGVAALRRLVPSPAGDLLLANASQDRLVVAASWGPSALAVGEPAYDVAPVKCLGLRRGSVYAISDAADDLMLPCPAHPIERGSLLCVPMLALGETIGVIHLESSETDAFGVDDERQAARVAEQVALAIANASLIKTMETMALTDPLTRLHNARFFDPFVDRELDAARRSEQPLGIIMIDLDHFKQFNDTHGHAGGDEALRVFARAALTVLRDSDTLARYGGEEFVVAVRDADLDTTAEVAERIRSAVEHSSVEVGLGRYANLTASFGVATTALEGYDRLTLVKAADRALYRAKRLGRNRVERAGAARRTARPSANAAEVAHDPGRVAGG